MGGMTRQHRVALVLTDASFGASLRSPHLPDVVETTSFEILRGGVFCLTFVCGAGGV